MTTDSICEDERKPNEGFLSIVSAPARRALENAGIESLSKLSEYREDDLLKLHGIGKTTIPKLRKALQMENLAFRTNS